MILDNLIIPNWVNWVAQDADGAVWGYEVEPLQQHHGWYENEVGCSTKLADQAENNNWQQSIHKIMRKN